MSETTLLPVTTGSYELEMVRSGEHAQTCFGRDTRSGREVVVKFAPTSDFASAARLVHEREVLMRLDHPNVVRVLDFIEEENRVGLVLERVPGRDLEAVLAEQGPLSERQLRAIATQLIDALSYLHRQRPPLIHRDIKPSNIILRPDGSVVLVDFGASRIASEAPKDTVALGTPGYAPPEQYGRGTDERADIYSLGVTIFELLSGRDPQGYGFIFPPLREVAPTVSPQMEAIVARAVQTDPRSRFHSADDMGRQLRGSGVGVSLPPLVGLAAAIICALGIGWVAGPLPRYLLGGGALLCGAFSGARWTRRQPSDDDQPSWARVFTHLAIVLFAALLGSVPLLLPPSAVTPHLRRISLALLARPVELDGSPVLLVGFALLLCVLGFLSGRVFARRLPAYVPLSLAVFTITLLSGYVELITRSDTAVGAQFSQPQPLWTRELGIGNGGRPDLMLTRGMSGPRDPSVLPRLPFGLSASLPSYVVADVGEDQYVVIDASNGKLLFGGTRSRFGPLQVTDGAVMERHEGGITSRRLTDGSVKWQWKLDGLAGPEVWFDDNMCVVTRGNRVEAYKVPSQTPLWTWTTPDGSTPFLMHARMTASLLVSTQGGGLTALDPKSGSVVWTRDNANNGGRQFMCGRNLVGALVNNHLTLADMASGKDLVSVRVPTGEIRPPVGQMGVDRYAFVVGKSPYAINAHDGRPLWPASSTGERFALRQTLPEMALFESDAGHLVCLEASTGMVSWEWWPGDFGRHLVPVAPPAAFCDARPEAVWMQGQAGGPLYALEPTTGRVVWRYDLPAGVQVIRVMQDERTEVLVTYDAQQKLTLTALPRPAELVMRRSPRGPGG